MPEPAAATIARVPTASPTARLVSLDVFRGVTMAAMVIVNNPGDWGHIYPPLEHAEWNGWTPTDLIFPFFLFIVGVSLTLSRSTMGSFARIVRRSIVIFAIGLFLTAVPFFDFATIRVPGVLARIAVCYLAAAFIYRASAPRNPVAQNARRRQGQILLACAVVLTVGYWLVMKFVPAPGGVAGDLTPGGNLGAYIDRAIFGPHLWKASRVWDPEGLLSTVPAIATTLLGAIAGLWLGSTEGQLRKVVGLLVAGAAGIAIGEAWNVAFPINKNLWTSSYVWFTAGAALWMLAACYWLLDVRGWKRWSLPFVILGMNAIALFALSALLAKALIYTKVHDAAGKVISLQKLIYDTAFVPLASPENASLAYAFANLVVLYAVLYALYRRGIFLKV